VLVDGRPQRTIWLDDADPRVVRIIDQTKLPHRLEILALRTYEDGVRAIRTMRVRGAPLIGATAAWSLYLATLGPRDVVDDAANALQAARPTAVNLAWAIARVRDAIRAAASAEERTVRAHAAAAALCEEDVATNRSLGEHGFALIEEAARRKGVANVLTHCNAGWLAAVDWGTATAPIYIAHARGVPVHVWVDETRPRNQGAALTAWELKHAGIPHTIVVDNAGGHLMQRGRVDLCLVGTDRTTRTGDVANKIGTYLKAVAARDNGVPFYVAAPSSSIDWRMRDGLREIPIEERDADEVLAVSGASDGDGDSDTDAGNDTPRLARVRIAPAGSPALNPAFDVTPARLVTGIITERGICSASEEDLLARFPEHRHDD
jgi:methylthioribose-1-phosphate isomerase